VEIKDVVLLPEGEMHARAEDSTPQQMGHNPRQFPVDRILAAADLGSSARKGITVQLERAMRDPDAAQNSPI
jgi:hypothetical protein